MQSPLHSLTNIGKKNAMENFYIGGHEAIRRIQITVTFLYINIKRLYDKMYVDDDAPPYANKQRNNNTLAFIIFPLGSCLLHLLHHDDDDTIILWLNNSPITTFLCRPL